MANETEKGSVKYTKIKIEYKVVIPFITTKDRAEEIQNKIIELGLCSYIEKVEIGREEKTV